MIKMSLERTIYENLNGFIKSKVLYTIVKYGISDILNDGPLSIVDIAKKTKTNKDNLENVLKYLIRIGYFEEIEDGIYNNNELSKKLSDYKSVILFNGGLVYNSFVNFEDLLNPLEKRTPFQIFHNYMGNFWSWLSTPENDDLLKTFSNFMSAVTVTIGYDWNQYVGKEILDIGGNKGQYFNNIVKKNPKIKVDIFDIPEVGEIVNDTILKFIGGDMFEHIPENYDVYFLRFILHNWNDEKCSIILKNIHSAIPPNGKLLISEQIITPESSAITYEYSFAYKKWI